MSLSPDEEEDARAGISRCTKEHPMPPGAKGRWRHMDAREVGEQQDRWPGGDIVLNECPNCGHSWEEELAQ